MGSAGTVVRIHDGFSSVRSDGNVALFNEDAQCPECCLLTPRKWEFSDWGTVAETGPNASYQDCFNYHGRDYDEDSLPFGAMWEVLAAGKGVRAHFDRHRACGGDRGCSTGGYAYGSFDLLEERDMVISLRADASRHPWPADIYNTSPAGRYELRIYQGSQWDPDAVMFLNAWIANVFGGETLHCNPAYGSIRWLIHSAWLPEPHWVSIEQTPAEVRLRVPAGYYRIRLLVVPIADGFAWPSFRYVIM